MQRTLVLIKPDGVQRGLVGTVLSRLERRGLKLVGLKMLRLGREMAERHYAEHRGKPFFEGLVGFITSGPLVAAVFEGAGAVAAVRQMMGATDPLQAAPGTLRGDLGLAIGRNVVHGSATPADAEREVALFFGPSELVDYRLDLEAWIYE
ncbi:MAG: nucleoside-diphosphate kinase [Acetobacteraceae bacterium]|nr:nucleoside-diphosphate kinase [Acetobacteraceae bacterium]